MEWLPPIGNNETLFSWIRNESCQSCESTVSDADPPIAMGHPYKKKWRFVGKSGFHCVAIDEDGKLWAWGNNMYGQLGDGTRTDRSSPVQIEPESTWKSVSVCEHHAVGIKKDGSLWVWGTIYLGSGQDSPTQIGTDTDWAVAFAASKYNLITKNDRSSWFWTKDGQGVVLPRKIGDAMGTH